MKHLQDKDFDTMKIYWRLVPHSKRDYWHASTAEWVRGVVMNQLKACYGDAELMDRLLEARNAVSVELGLPPWSV